MSNEGEEVKAATYRSPYVELRLLILVTFNIDMHLPSLVIA
jgi:hypothetical protein